MSLGGRVDGLDPNWKGTTKTKFNSGLPGGFCSFWKEFCKVGGGVKSVFLIHPNDIWYFVQDTKPIWKHWVVISRVPLPISSSPLSVCFYFAKFAERDADNDGAASGAESTGGSGSIWAGFWILSQVLFGKTSPAWVFAILLLLWNDMCYDYEEM